MTKNPRKAWRTDLKWLFGILATVLLTVSLTSLALYRVATNPDVAKFQKMYAKQSPVKNDGLFGMLGNPMDPKSKAGLKLKINGKTYTMDQLQKMPPADKEKLMTKMDPKELENLTKMMTPSTGSPMPGKGQMPEANKGSAPDMEVFGNQMGPMIIQSIAGPIISAVSDATKGSAMTLMFISFPLGLLCLILMLVVSYRWGRLTSFSVTLLLASLPVFSIALFLKMMSSFNGPVKGPDLFSFIAAAANANFALFLTLIVVGCFLLMVSLGGSVLTALMNRKPAPKKPLKPVKQQPLPKAS